MSVTPFNIAVPASELDLLQRKLELTRLPIKHVNEQWGEDNGVTIKLLGELLEFWRTKYDWRAEEARLNKLPQFIVSIEMCEFGSLDIHFVHARSPKENSIPLLIAHGWPGNCFESQKLLPGLLEAGFDVVSPDMPGYGFSPYHDKPGFKLAHHAEVCHKLMTKLGYNKYVAQGGDWGSATVRLMAIQFPQSVKAIHLNLLWDQKPESIPDDKEYTEYEKEGLARTRTFAEKEAAYFYLQCQKPRTLGAALHDSPIGMLAWMADKLMVWTDSYPWTPTELITWTLIHYFAGPTTGLAMYKENGFAEMASGPLGTSYIATPTGYSAFPKEMEFIPRSWAEARMNVVFWEEHTEGGGHFPPVEKPEQFMADLVKFFVPVWNASIGKA